MDCCPWTTLSAAPLYWSWAGYCGVIHKLDNDVTGMDTSANRCVEGIEQVLSTQPCGAPVLKLRVVDVWWHILILWKQPDQKLLMRILIEHGSPRSLSLITYLPGRMVLNTELISTRRSHTSLSGCSRWDDVTMVKTLMEQWMTEICPWSLRLCHPTWRKIISASCIW